jgi:cyclopropane fatty-acyl-phospholipid synthase-like methyltransferase
VWGPEGLREADAGLLGEVRGKQLLEIGAGAAQCSRYAARLGARVVATDISAACFVKVSASTGVSPTQPA